MSLARLQKIDATESFFYDLLKKIVDRVRSIEPQSQIFVFGSFVEKKLTNESDIDIAIIVPDHWHQRLFLEKLYEVGTLSAWPLDLLVFKKNYFELKKEIGGVCFEISNTGVEIYPHWSIDESFWKKV